MGNYNDFDLDIKKVQGDATPNALTSVPCEVVNISLAVCSNLSCNNTCTCAGKASCADSCGNTCRASCGGHCR